MTAVALAVHILGAVVWPAGVAASTSGMSHGYAERLEAAMAALCQELVAVLSDVLFLQQMSGKRTTGH
jgi:hypothetical protein